MAINWEHGYRVSYFASVVDPGSWVDVDRFDIMEGSITRDDEGLRQSADISCRSFEIYEELWIRIYLEARQNDNGERIALFTGLATSPDVEYDGPIETHELQCYSVLKPAEDINLKRGWYILKGSDGASAIKKLLSVCPCPVVIDGEGPKLKDTIIAEDSENHLSMVEKILEAIDWRLRISGDGTITITSKLENQTPIVPVATLTSLNNDYVEPRIKLKTNWFDCPNVFRATSGTLSAIAKDEDPNSLLSIESRGREIWLEDNSANLNDGESIAEYAMRRLKEEQDHYITASYDRRYDPDIFTSDVICLHYPTQKLDGYYRITSQTVSLTYAAQTNEEVIRVG